MNHPQLLFFYRLATYKGKYVGKCITCDSSSMRNWNTKNWWTGFALDSSVPVRFELCTSNLSHPDIIPQDMKKPEESIHDLKSTERIGIRRAQNLTYMFFQEPPKTLAVPFFVSTVNPTIPTRLNVVMEVDTLKVWELPEAIDYIKTQKATAVDRWDEMLVPKPTPLKLPVGLWFPANISDDHKESPAVYQITEWIDERRAKVQLACADGTVRIGPGTNVRRRYKEMDASIGRVIE